MLYFFLFLLIVFVVAPLVSAAVKLWSIRRKARSFMNDMFGQAGTFGFGQAGASSRKSAATGRRRKKIGRDVGEYVAFTEVEVTGTSRRDTAPAAADQTERQVSDAEWEDIK